MILALLERCSAGVDVPGGIVETCPLYGWEWFVTAVPILLIVKFGLMAWVTWKEKADGS